MLDGKYGHHLPLDRQSKIFARQKIVLHRPMLADLAARASHLCTIWFGDWFCAHGLDFELTPEVLFYHSYPLLIEAASEGRGICIAWPQLSGDHFANGRLISLPGTEMETENGYFLVSRTKQHATERFSALHNLVLEKARAMF